MKWAVAAGLRDDDPSQAIDSALPKNGVPTSNTSAPYPMRRVGDALACYQRL